MLCGVNFCPGADDNSTLISAPDTTQVYIMTGIFLSLTLISSVVLATLVDPLSRFVDEKNMAANKKTGLQLVGATFSHMKNPVQLLLVPITIYSGVEQAYIAGDYTAAYVSCGLGVHMVGYVLITYGACDAICSYAFTPLVTRLGRVPVFTLGALLNAVCVGVMFFWAPHPDNMFMFFLVPALWGISDAVWQTQINALYGVVFPGQSEAAFSNYRLWESLGFVLCFALQTKICNNIKLYITAGFLVLGMVGYYMVEVMIAMKKRTTTDKVVEKVSKF